MRSNKINGDSELLELQQSEILEMHACMPEITKKISSVDTADVLY